MNCGLIVCPLQQPFRDTAHQATYRAGTRGWAVFRVLQLQYQYLRFSKHFHASEFVILNWHFKMISPHEIWTLVWKDLYWRVIPSKNINIKIKLNVNRGQNWRAPAVFVRNDFLMTDSHLEMSHKNFDKICWLITLKETHSHNDLNRDSWVPTLCHLRRSRCQHY